MEKAYGSKPVERAEASERRGDRLSPSESLRKAQLVGM